MPVVETIAGPALCRGATVVDRSSAAVRAVAVTGDPPTVYAATGTPANSGLRVVSSFSPRSYSVVHIGGLITLSDPSVDFGERAPIVAVAPYQDGVLVATTRQVVAFGPGPGAGAPGPIPAQVTPSAGSSGDGGPATQAQFTGIRALATDDARNLYIADAVGPSDDRFRVRFVNRGADPVTFYGGTPDQLTVAPGAVDTVAGGGQGHDAGVAGGGQGHDAGAAPGGSGGKPEQAPARRGELRGAPALAAVGDRLYVGVSGARRPGAIRARILAVNLASHRMNAHGVEIPAGAMATLAEANPLSSVAGLDADDAGNLFVADRDAQRVRKLDAGGTSSVVAGSGPSGASGGGFNGNGRPAVGARLDHPTDVKVGPRGELYVADGGSGQLRVVDPDGVIRAVAGNGLGAAVRCRVPGGPHAGAKRGRGPEATPGQPADDFPLSVAVDARGVVHFTANQSGRVMTVTSPGVVAPLAGAGAVRRADQVAARPGGGLYVLDGGDNRVRLVNNGRRPIRSNGMEVAPGKVVTVAGNGTIGAKGDGGRAVEAQLSGRGALAADGRGNLLILDTGNQRLRQVDGKGRITTILGSPGNGGGGPTCCARPMALAVGPGDEVYLADANLVWLYNRSRHVSTAHGQKVPAGAVRVVAGGGPAGAVDDGIPAVMAELKKPDGLAVDGAGNLYIADGDDNSVRRVDRAGTITTAAGNGQPSFNGDGLPVQLTGLYGPTGLAVDRCGDLVIADSNNNRVRIVRFVPACLATAEPRRGRARSAPGRVVLVLALAVLAAAATTTRTRRRRSTF